MMKTSLPLGGKGTTLICRTSRLFIGFPSMDNCVLGQQSSFISALHHQIRIIRLYRLFNLCRQHKEMVAGGRRGRVSTDVSTAPLIITARSVSQSRKHPRGHGNLGTSARSKLGFPSRSSFSSTLPECGVSTSEVQQLIFLAEDELFDRFHSKRSA